MKILYFAQEAWEEDYMRGKLPGIELVSYVGSIQDNAEVADTSADALSVFVNSIVGSVEFDHFPNLKLLATRSTGFDHIDMVEAKKRGITVVSVPSYGVNTVAEFAFALLLALSRRVCDAHERVAETGSFSQRDLTGFDLSGKTIGIVGCGNIGVHVVKIANGFGMHPIVFDVKRDEALAKKLGFTYAELPELLAQSDVITLHVPYNKHTHHLINSGNISQIKKGAYLINTSRGAVVETQALVQALRSGSIAGAGLDVLEEEGDMADEMKLLTGNHPKEDELKIILENHYLMSHPRVIVTPHIAFDTKEAIERILDTTTENIFAYQKGTPQNVVTPV